VISQPVYYVTRSCGVYLRGVVSVWLEVGQEYKVELLMQSRDGDVIPVGGVGGAVVHMHVLVTLAHELQRVGAWWGRGEEGGGGEGGEGGRGGRVGGGGGGGEGEKDAEKVVPSERGERGEREGGQGGEECGAGCQSLSAWRRKMRGRLQQAEL